MSEPNSIIFLGNIVPSGPENNALESTHVRNKRIEEMQKKVDEKFYFYLLKYAKRQEMAARAAKRFL